jgi:hypothetical protein
MTWVDWLIPAMDWLMPVMFACVLVAWGVAVWAIRDARRADARSRRLAIGLDVTREQYYMARRALAGLHRRASWVCHCGEMAVKPDPRVRHSCFGTVTLHRPDRCQAVLSEVTESAR